MEISFINDYKYVIKSRKQLLAIKKSCTQNMEYMTEGNLILHAVNLDTKKKRVVEFKT
jgi:hypothetical protein